MADKFAKGKVISVIRCCRCDMSMDAPRSQCGLGRTLAVHSLIFLFGAGLAFSQVTPSTAPQAGGESLAPSTTVMTVPPTSSSSLSTLGESPLMGGIPTRPVPGVLKLTLEDAIQRGLKYNLGLYLSGQGTTSARGARLRALSRLLPTLVAHVSQSEQQVNLAALGFPGTAAKAFGISTIVGPFPVFDTRAAVTQSLSFAALHNYRASLENMTTADLNYQNARDLVVLVSGGLYMEALAGAARIQAVQVQVDTAQSLYTLAVDQNKAGVVPAIDVLRAQVELQGQQQRLVAARNNFEIQKLQLERAIGLPVSQQIEFSEASMPTAPMPPITFDEALRQAYATRADYKAALSQVRAAELTRKAASDERLPSIQINADYGVLGNYPNSNHGTFTATGALVVPIFQGGRVKGDIIEADSLLAQRRAVAEDTRNRVEYEVRSSMLDLNSAAQQVAVAQSSVGLAEEQVRQAQDRFKAGVTNNIEVIQAQEALATTNDNYINSLLALNLAKLSLARALGVAEQATKVFLGGK
jgi:outer membrane protein TolC